MESDHLRETQLQLIESSEDEFSLDKQLVRFYFSTDGCQFTKLLAEQLHSL